LSGRHFLLGDQPQPKHLRADAVPVTSETEEIEEEEGRHFLPDEPVSDQKQVLVGDDTGHGEPTVSEPLVATEASQAGRESAPVAVSQGSGGYLTPRRAPARQSPLRAFRGRVPRQRRLVLAVSGVVALAVGAGAGAAFAFFSSSGSGSGSGTTGTLEPVTVTAFVGGDTPGSVLVPRGTADVILRVINPNAQVVTLISVSPNGTVTADASHPGCTVTGVTLTAPTTLSDPITPLGTTLVHLNNAASMSAASSNGCQGATFSIPVSIAVHE